MQSAKSSLQSPGWRNLFEWKVFWATNRVEGDAEMTYPISEIQGIGTDAAAILKSDGIRTTIGLLRSAKTPKQRLKIALKTGTPEKSVLDWVTAADRMRVKGVGWEYAELLRAAGVRTVNELRFRNPKKLADAMVEINTKRKLVRILPSVNTVMRWIEDAKKLPPVIRY
jgi:predicted flap endonuclease-1-like 5' DNA nuclease